jgi:hypothetical protein
VPNLYAEIGRISCRVHNAPLTLIMVFHKRKMEERRRQDITDRSRPLRILIRSTYTSASQIVDAPVWPRILG